MLYFHWRLFIYLFIHLSIYLFIHLVIYSFIYLFVCLRAGLLQNYWPDFQNLGKRRTHYILGPVPRIPPLQPYVKIKDIRRISMKFLAVVGGRAGISWWNFGPREAHTSAITAGLLKMHLNGIAEKKLLNLDENFKVCWSYAKDKLVTCSAK